MRNIGRHWLYGEWPNSWKTLNIALLELLLIMLSLHVWEGGHMSNQCVSYFTDNAALVDIFNQQTSYLYLYTVCQSPLLAARRLNCEGRNSTGSPLAAAKRPWSQEPGVQQPSQMFLTWVKARPQHRELRALLFTNSVWNL